MDDNYLSSSVAELGFGDCINFLKNIFDNIGSGNGYLAKLILEL